MLRPYAPIFPMPERFICIHGHFYQPPRENPWLEAVEQQDSAYPYHDWNERVTAECYEQNAASRILDGQNQIVQIVNNYSRISFNVGPTLLSWLEQHTPAVYEAILAADAESRALFGHGSAMAQCYNHLIMPLANRRDKITQIRWGIADFEQRFGRRPEGMWLPETAVDLESLDLMAAHGILFTVLEPGQASHCRRIGEPAWGEAAGGRIDPTRPYLVRLSEGRSIAVFFYDGPVSRAVAFERLLANGAGFAGRIAGTFDEQRGWPQLANIATDGETYGHHHRHGEMALAYALHHIEARGLARLTNYAAFLAAHPPTHEARIVERTAWSCVHGVGRWSRDCGCNSGGSPGWNQSWREPLRAALDWLRDELAPRFEGLGRELFNDPWAARDAYIEVVLDRSDETVGKFLGRHARGRLDEPQRIAALKLMELQRHLLLMYTSCGWFFDDLAGIETVQVIMYAGRAIQLATELFGVDVETPFLDRLARARSNDPARGDGRKIYETSVRPAMVDLRKVGAHYAMASLFASDEERDSVYCYRVEREHYHLIPSGKSRLALGRIRITSQITGESARLSFGVLHLGDHNISGGVREFQGEAAYAFLVEELTELFLRADIPGVIRLVDRNFGHEAYSLKLLFGDEQRKILSMILDSSLGEAEAAYRQIYEHHAPLMRFLASMGSPVPREFQIAAEFAINTELRRLIEAESLELDRIHALRREAARSGVTLDSAGLGYALARAIERITEEFRERPEEVGLLQQLDAVVGLARTMPFEVDVWKTQNAYYELLQGVYADFQDEAQQGYADARQWVLAFTALGRKLKFRVAS
jgi:alpha-amylase/alpha-mannosidase (GH57 family)